MKKKIAILLLISIALTVFVACAETDDNKPSDNIVGEDEIEYLDSIPANYNLEGAAIGIFYGDHIEAEVLGEAEHLDIVYSKIYERNDKVSTRLNCKLNFISAGNGSEWKEFTDPLRRAVATFDDSFQIAMSTDNSIIQNNIFSLFHNMNDSYYIDISADYWYDDMILESSIDGYYYRFLMGDISLGAMGSACAIFYNKDLYAQYVDPGNPNGVYDMVLDGTWTFEKLDIATRNSFIDLGGDNNIYGYTLTRYGNQIDLISAACDVKVVERDSNGKPNIVVNNDKSIEFTNRLYKFLYENPGANLYYPNKVGSEVGKPMFVDKKYVFALNTVKTMLNDSYREMEDAYGVVPYPKWDEEQEKYISTASGSTLVGCPKNISSDIAYEEASAVIEALCSEAHVSVRPAFYEQACQKAYARDDTTARMIDIICGFDDEIATTFTYSFAIAYQHHIGSIGGIFRMIMNKGPVGSPNFTSEYESKITAANTAIDELWLAYLNAATTE